MKIAESAGFSRGEFVKGATGYLGVQRLKYTLNNYLGKNYTELFDSRIFADGFTCKSCLGICKGAIVGVYLPYTKDFAVSAIAVWKIGGIFMPTDAAYPSKRLKYMVENSKASALISGRSLQDMIENFYINFCDMNIFHMQLYRQDSQQ